jgi:hypothetical protein
MIEKKSKREKIKDTCELDKEEINLERSKSMNVETIG